MKMNTVRMKRKTLLLLGFSLAALLFLLGRVAYLQLFQAAPLQEMAKAQQTRDRALTPLRGEIVDRKGEALAANRSVCAVSVIPSQVVSPEETARLLSEKLGLSYEAVLEKISQKVALVRIASKVEPGISQQIRQAQLPGVMVDEDVQRVYPYGDLAAQVIGFVGKDNQGILGLEAKYNEAMTGEGGMIQTPTDSRGRQVAGDVERQAPKTGLTLETTLDVTIQQYAEQTLENAVKAKGAKGGVLIVMNPQNGEIYAMANAPSFDLNDPFTITDPDLAAKWDSMTEEEQSAALNQMWRNDAINDTYEPGSTFKILTTSAGLEEGVVTEETPFFCNGSHTVGGRTIKCWRYPRSHGSQTFVEGVQNSCNPVFMMVAERLGVDTFYSYLEKFGLKEKTGIDLAGEAKGILHTKEAMGPVELATYSFGQGFQITPLELMRVASAAVNGGYLITPHIGKALLDETGQTVETFSYEKGAQVLSEETSATMRKILESVVAEGTGNKAAVAGYRIGGKTATSEKLPRRSGKYIASFLAFAPAEDPEVMALLLIDEPQGTYYGGTVAGPVMGEFLSQVLPYLKVPQTKTEEVEMLVEVPQVTGTTVSEAKKRLEEAGLRPRWIGDGLQVQRQFPRAGEKVRRGEEVEIQTQTKSQGENGG